MSDLDAVEAVIRRSEQLWNQQDYDSLKGLWDVDEPEPWYIAEEVEQPLIGMPAILDYWAANTKLLDRITVAFSNIRLKPFGADGMAALYDLRFDLKLNGPRKPIGGNNRVIALFRRRGNWRYCSYVEAPVSPIVYVRQLYEKNVNATFLESLNPKAGFERPQSDGKL